MDKFRLSKSSVNWFDSSSINSIATILVLLIAFNIGWLVMFLRVCSQLAVIQSLNQTLFNFESFLLLGNLSIFSLFIAYVLAIKSLREISGRRN